MREILQYRPVEYVEDCYILFLPIFMCGHLRIPTNLNWTLPLVDAAVKDYKDPYSYIYLSVDSRFIAANSYQKRPGWHVDGYLTNDENYCWTDCNPTEYVDLGRDLRNVGLNHEDSLIYFDYLASKNNEKIKLIEPYSLYKMNGQIHRTPLIRQDCHRTFLKISFSTEQYNLKGNAKNSLFNYNWEYYEREKVRNCPIYENHDFFKEMQ